MKTMKVKITFKEELLGSASAKQDIHSEFIAREGDYNGL